MFVGDGRPAQHTVNNGSNCMSALLYRKGAQSHLGYLFSRLLASFWRLFDTFWFHLGSNWASEAWTRDTWYFLDFKGGSRIQSQLADGGDNMVCRPTTN